MIGVKSTQAVGKAKAGTCVARGTQARSALTALFAEETLS